jgi:hypothetical protein
LQQYRQIILSGSVEKTYPSGHGGGGGGSEVAGAVEAAGLGAGAGAGEVGVIVARAANGGEEDGPGEVDGVEMVLGARAEAERSGVTAGSIAGKEGGSEKLSDCAVAGEGVGVGLGGGGERAGGDVRGGGETQKSSSTPTPLSSSISHRLLAAFLVLFAGGGEGVGCGSTGEGSGAGGTGGGSSGRDGAGEDAVGGREVRIGAAAFPSRARRRGRRRRRRLRVGALAVGK